MSLMSHMDERFSVLLEKSMPKDMKEDPNDPFGGLEELAQNMGLHGTAPPETVKNTYVVQVPRAKDGGTIETQVFVPEGDGPHAGLLYLHGGGYCIQNFQETVYRRICNSSGAVVVVPKYRLAPQHRFPAAADDCLDAYKWMTSEAQNLDIDTSRLFVSGESAGGGLTASLAIRLRDEKVSPALAGQIHLFPFLSPWSNTPSYVHMGHGHHWLTRDMCRLMWNLYQSSPEDMNNPIFHPFATSSYEGLPPSLTIVGGADPLLDDGVIYGSHLKAAGVDSTTVTFADMPHVFNQFDKTFPAESDQVYAQIGQFVKTVGKQVRSKL